MPLFENNLSPYLTIVEATEPSAPSAGQQRLYIDSTTHLLKATNSSGTDRTIEGFSNPMSAVGDIIQGTTAGAAASLAAPAAGKVLTGAGTTTPLVYAYPPGYEFDYAQLTTGVNITATTEATANTVVTGGAVTYDGSTVVIIEAFVPSATKGTTYTQWWLYDGSSSIGAWGVLQVTGGGSVYLRRRLTPSNASHTYSLRGSVDGATGTATGGAGGAGVYVPGFIRITKA
jgi:hypothetical protein